MRSFVNGEGKLVLEREEVRTPQGLRNLFTAGIDDGFDPARATLTQPYANSVWVMRAIKHVSGPIAAVPVVVTRDRRGGDQVVEDEALTKFLEEPFDDGGGQGLSREDGIEASVGWLKLKGEFFWVLDDTWLKSRTKMRGRIAIARPDDMRPVLERRDGPIVGWEWRYGCGREILIPEQVVQVKFWNPYDRLRGLSEWEAAEMAANADYASAVFARNLAENNGDRGPIVIGRDGVASPEQREQIESALRQKRRLARQGDFRAVFMTGDLEVTEPGLQAVDAAFVTQRIENRHEIYVAFGVPPSMASLVANYSVGAASDRYKLIEETCVPTGKKVCQAFERVVGLWFGGQGTYFCELDWDEHSVMQEVRAERMDSATKAVDRGMPWEKASEYFRLKLPRFAGDDVGRVPFNLVEIGGEDAEVDPEPAPDSEEDPAADLEKLFQGRLAAAPPTPRRKAVDAERHQLWERVHRAREPWEKRFESRFRRLLMDARRETLARLETYAEKAVEQRMPTDALQVVFDLGGWLREFVRGMTEVSRNAIEAAGFELWDELGRDDPLTMPAEDVLTAVQNRENRLANTGTAIWEKVREDIATGITEGDSIDDLSKRIKASFNGINNSRARTIATTETTVAYEVGRDVAFREAGVQWTEWVTAGDGRERITHAAADGQVREYGEAFEVGGHELHYPGDPAGPPEEVINCRCVRIARGGPAGGDIIGTETDEEIPY